MKLKETVSWIIGTLQRHLFPRLEECWERSLTDKEQQLVSILELIQIEKFVGQPRPKRCGRKLRGRRALARAFVVKPPAEKPARRKKGRPRRGEVREPKAETRLERQCRQSAAEALAELPVYCDVGTKRNSQGYKESWRGYKLHADVNDCCLPISVELTAASLHDNQVAIPLMKMTSERLDYLYDLMDAAYDAKPIYEVSRTLGHVPIIDKNSRGKDVIPVAPHEAVRHRERSVAERFNSRLKEEFGARNVMVRGIKKVRLHLMFGVIALFADQVLKLIS